MGLARRSPIERDLHEDGVDVDADVLGSYIDAAMRRACFEELDDHTYFGSIAILPGVWANADTLESCRDELQEVLEDWIGTGLRLNHPFPSLDGLNLRAA